MARDDYWTAENSAELTRLWNEGLTGAEIGKRLKVTRCAVIGKAHRLKLPARPSPIIRTAYGSDDQIAIIRKRAAALRAAKKKAAPKKRVACAITQPVAAQSLDPARDKRLAHFAARGTGTLTCLWPMWSFGEKPTHQHCTQLRVNGRSFCVQHCADAFILIDPSKITPAGYFEYLNRQTGITTADRGLTRLGV